MATSVTRNFAKLKLRKGKASFRNGSLKKINYQHEGLTGGAVNDGGFVAGILASASPPDDPDELPV